MSQVGTMTIEKPITSYESNSDLDSRRESASKLVQFRIGLNNFYQNNTSAVIKLILLILLIGYSVYFGLAIRHSVSGAKPLIVITSIVVFFLIYYALKAVFGKKIYKSVLKPMEQAFRRNSTWIKYIVIPLVAIGIVFFLAFSVVKEVRQLQSLSGVVAFVLILYTFSMYPDKVNWRPVIWGFFLQFVMGVIVLRWRHGYNAVNWLSNQITKFINYSNEGAAAVFGDPFLLFHPFVFVGMPMLIYVGAVMSILYYYGLTQRAAGQVGWVMQLTLGTTAVETLSVSANIFLNGMDTMLMLRPYLDRLTKSEFHCFLVGNHSTVAGFAFAIFVLMGAPPQHLLSAAVMSAPAAIAISKLSYPETEESTTKTQKDVQVEKSSETNVMEAAANGAGIAGKTVMAVVVNMLAFISMLGFINSTLAWLGNRVGIVQLSFQKICSYLLYPVSILMGIEPGDAKEVGSLLGFKVFTSELLAYQELGDSISANRLSRRSAAIATYALCGFSGLSNLAIAVGVWNAVCPSKTREMAKQMIRAVVNANVACFMTACVAGLLYNPDFSAPAQGDNAIGSLLNSILGLIPSFKDLTSLLD
ncbi:unnamed protein product [Dimorphilus gyrociliatus]|uniref:Uncharacterized protein n=1 Tax=Dimorphilus gyrociliatus TaxID=2664684 RepID=A0A7I8W2M1_9ANNE|nr:unnamed protein product [Dimorphilus gyrociliatus]